MKNVCGFIIMQKVSDTPARTNETFLEKTNLPFAILNICSVFSHILHHSTTLGTSILPWESLPPHFIQLLKQMFRKQIKSEATWNRLKREERTHLAREKLRLCQHSTMLHRANTLIFLSSTVHLDVTTWGNFLNYLHKTGVFLSEPDGNAAWHHHSSSLPHMELVLCLSCHIFLLDSFSIA